MAHGARRLGYQHVSTGHYAINPVPRDGRNACDQIGFCVQGCRSGAKWSTLYTEFPRAEATGRYEVRANAMALEIHHDAAGKVSGVLYADAAANLKQATAIYDAAGAQTITEWEAYPTGHNLGTCRMSADPDHGVVNAFGQSHHVANLFVSDGSQFTTSAAANPTLTIIAPTIRQAEFTKRCAVPTSRGWGLAMQTDSV